MNPPHDYTTYLNNLRDSGVINMLDAVRYLENDFSLSRADARAVLRAWMASAE